MILLDIGNTYTKWEIISLVCSCRGSFLTQELFGHLMDLLSTYPEEREILASWVGKKVAKPEIERILGDRGVAFVVVQSEPELAGLKNGYYEPEKLGVDRWLAMLGLWKKIGRALCVVDAGTALTIDLVNSEGNHLGGFIVPGVRTMASSLNMATAQIDCSLTAEVDAGLLPGRNTAEAVQRGVILALVGAIDFAIQNITNQERVGDFDCFIGGGDAELLQPFLGSRWQIEPSLVLSGLKAYFAEELTVGINE